MHTSFLFFRSATLCSRRRDSSISRAALALMWSALRTRLSGRAQLLGAACREFCLPSQGAEGGWRHAYRSRLEACARGGFVVVVVVVVVVVEEGVK